MRMKFRQIFPMLRFAAILPAAAQTSPIDKASVTNPSASFLDVTARRAALASATNPRVVAALKDKWGCTRSEQPEPPTGRMIIPHHYLSGSSGPINPEEAKATVPYQKLQDSAAE